MQKRLRRARRLVLPGVAAAILIASLPPMTAVAGESTVAVLVVERQTTSDAAEDLVERLGGTVDRRLAIIDGFLATVPPSAVGVLTRAPAIASVSPDYELRVQAAYGESSGVASAVYVDAMRASKVWARGNTGAGVNVALIDTGVDTSGDLAGRVVHSEDFTVEQDHADGYGHGTFVAGLIAGSGTASAGAIKGAAPSAGIVSLKIAGRNGSTDVTSVLLALEWVMTFRDAHDIRVVNLSLGYESSQPTAIDPLNFAVERLWNAGIVVVTAAGNSTTGGSVTKPGDDPLVITVGASDDRTTATTSDDTVAAFSRRGPTADGVAKPDILAPGRSVVSSRSPGSTIDEANPSARVETVYARASGTSFSTALVSGAAALMLARSPELTPDDVKRRLIATARGAGGSSIAGGPGVVDAFAAVVDGGTVATSPVAPPAQPATGTGSLQATRGDACLRGEDGLCLTDAEADALLGFDAEAYRSDGWAGSQWAGSQWAGSQWAGSQWAGSQWAGSQWAGSQWAGSQWAGSQWAGSQWAGSQWAGNQWASVPWAATEEELG